MTTRTWKVYGQNINRNIEWDFSNTYGRGTCIINVKSFEEFAIVTITCDTVEECERELNGQLNDGIFENVRTGNVEEIGA